MTLEQSRVHAAPRLTPTEPVDDPATSFNPQRATQWLNPGLLLRSAGEVLISGVLGQYNDKRETMGALPADPPVDLRTGRQELWIDYVADTGDGFPATYAVADLIARPELHLAADYSDATLTTRRGRLLVMGGDQCYPSAHVRAYDDRLIGPFRAALAEVTDVETPELLALPGNHDWYDGLTAFMRTFCQQRRLGAWQTRQSRSYFAVRMPGRWWMWGVDIQFDTYIDDVQRRYFRDMATHLAPGDAVVLCSAKPSWVAAGEDDLEAYATLDFIERTLIRPTGARVRVWLSGDRHHYARYESADGGQKLTAGGGGAYLTPTHHLPESIAVPPAQSRSRSRSVPVEHRRQALFPTPERSRRLAWGVLRLPWTTPSFAGFLGGVHTLLALTMVWALSPELRALPDRVVITADALRSAGPLRLASALVDSLSSVVLALGVVLAAVLFTKHPRTWRGWAAGLPHGLVQLVAAVFATWVAAQVAAPLPGGWLLAGVVPIVLVVGGLLSTEIVAVYLLLADRFRLNSNELFAGQAIADYKNFLRLHVDADGWLTIHPIGLEKVPRRWRRSSGPDRASSCFEPVGRPLQARLIEEPVRVSPSPGKRDSRDGGDAVTP